MLSDLFFVDKCCLLLPNILPACPIEQERTNIDQQREKYEAGANNFRPMERKIQRWRKQINHNRGGNTEKKEISINKKKEIQRRMK